MRSITAGAAARSPAGLAIDGVEAAFSTMGRNGPAQASAWQANRRTAARYPQCIPRAPAIRVTINGKSAFLCHILAASTCSSSGSRKTLARQSLPLARCCMGWATLGLLQDWCTKKLALNNAEIIIDAEAATA